MGGIGNAIGTGLDFLLNRPGAGASAVPKKLILSSRVRLVFRSPEGDEIDIAEWDQMRKQKLFDEKKRFKPFGSTKSISLGKDNGWELTLSGQKTDGTLDYLVYIYEKYLNGYGISSIPNESNTFNASRSIGTKPSFDIIEYTQDNSGNFIAYVYKDVTLIGYDENTPSDNNPVEYSATLFSPSRDKIGAITESETDLETVLDKIIIDLVNRNKQ